MTHSGQLSRATSKNLSVVNSYVSIHSATNVITCARLHLKTNVATDEGKDRNETGTMDKEIK